MTGNNKKDKNKIMFFIFAALWFLVLIVFCIKYNADKDKIKMIRMYNEGNKMYEYGIYDVAEDCLELAYFFNPSEDEICPIRINEALSIVAPLSEDNIDDSNVDEALTELEKARKMLIDDGCANASDNNGHSRDAQTLKNEIDEYIAKLNMEYKSQENIDPDEPDDPEDDSKQDELRETFENIQRDGMTERKRQEEGDRFFDWEYEFFDGKSW